MRRLVWVIVLGIHLCSCHALFPFSYSRSSDGGQDSARVADQTGSVEQLLVDGGPVETALPDDAAILPDTVKPDAAIPPDAVKPDTAIPPDTTQSDLPTGPPCSGQAQPVPVAQWSGKMVLCDAVSGGSEQCGIDSLCNTSAGWHLCTATEYKAHGGTKSGAPKAAWLHACIRDGSTPHSPLDKLCKCLSDLDTVDTQISWNCVTGGGWKSTNAFHIGLVAQSKCQRVGENLPATEAFWEYRKADAVVHAAVCCHN